MTSHHDGRPPHPRYGAPLSGAPKVFEGVTFRPYRISIARTALISDDFRLEVRSSTERSTHTAVVDGKALAPRFRYLRTAVAAAIKAASAGDA